MATLKDYNSKRDFAKTSEPKGSMTKSKDPVFVVQYHIASRPHYDFRLSYNGVLLSWAVPKGPSFVITEKRLAIKVEDHPFDYKDFEGIIEENNYGAGTVMIWDEGTYTCKNIKQGIKSGNLKFELKGHRLKGKWALINIEDNNWLLIKEKDKYAKEKYDISKYKKSIKTKRTMEEIKNDIRKN